MTLQMEKNSFDVKEKQVTFTFHPWEINDVMSQNVRALEQLGSARFLHTVLPLIIPERIINFLPVFLW